MKWHSNSNSPRKTNSITEKKKNSIYRFNDHLLCFYEKKRQKSLWEQGDAKCFRYEENQTVEQVVYRVLAFSILEGLDG